VPECAFCELLSAGPMATWVFEDDVSVAFLDHRPVFIGHCLVVPRTHAETLLDLPTDAVGPLFTRVQLLARAVEAAMDADGSFVAMNNRVSQSVPHLHVHIVPRRRRDGLRGFFWPRQRYADGEQEAVASRIRATLTTADP
jgi:histidine triad (HIT) family protein